MSRSPLHVHLIGIGGTGMTALAGLLDADGCRVTGSDRALYPPTSEILAELGLEVASCFDAAHLDPAPDLVVVGNAVSRGNPEVEELLDRDLTYTSMPAILSSRFLRGRHSIVVAGTHGKTTTASMLAWVLSDAGRDPSFLIGGLPQNFRHPFRLGKGAAFVVEGDEYDTAFFDKGPKFMHYRPDTAIVGTVEFDHADIYRDLDEVKTAFRRLTNIVPRRGLIVRHEDCAVTREVTEAALSRVEGFGSAAGRWIAEGFHDSGAGCRFRVLRDGESFCEIELQLSGEHNARNALSVVAAAAEQGLHPDEISAALGRFKGVRRRLEVRGEEGGVIVLDDFAHHPTAIDASLRAARQRYPEGRIWAVVEPRSWSLRRSIFQDRMAAAFSAADEIVVAAVYGADQIPDGERLDLERLTAELARSGASARHIPDVGGILELIADRAAPGDAVVVMSNGSFDDLHTRLLDALRRRSQATGAGHA